MSYETDLSFRDRVVKEEYKDGKYMKRAGQYFDPSAREYLNHMEVFVVDSPMVNAFSSIGGVIVVFSGLIDYYKQLEASGKITSAENVITRVKCND